jgi:hypothetical protein
MGNNGRLSSRPPRIGSSDPEALAAFISGAGVQTESAAPIPIIPAILEPVIDSEPYPWEAPGIRADVAKVYNVRLPEPYLLKLKYIANHTPNSMQQFCLKSLLPAIDAQIEALIAPNISRINRP